LKDEQDKTDKARYEIRCGFSPYRRWDSLSGVEKFVEVRDKGQEKVICMDEKRREEITDVIFKKMMWWEKETEAIHYAIDLTEKAVREEIFKEIWKLEFDGIDSPLDKDSEAIINNFWERMSELKKKFGVE
jgi:hypothetical protein